MIYGPLVSVIINNYNYDRFIAKAIKSVLNQTYKNYELIIVDDGSTDSSRTIIEKYYKEYPDIIIPIYKKNGGQASALNAGFAASKGDVICFLDSDDYWFHNRIEKTVVYHDRYGIIQNNMLKNGQDSFVRNLRNDIDFEKLFKELGYSESNAPTSALSFRREVLEEVFPIPEETLRICADDFIRCNALYYSNIYNIKEALGYYRVHGENKYYGNYDWEEKKELQNITKRELNNKLNKLGLPLIPVKSYSYEDILCYSLNVESEKSYLLYGTGEASKKIFNFVENNGGKVVLFSDSNCNKWGNSFLGKLIISPEEIHSNREQFYKIIIASMYIDEICDKLEKLEFIKEKDLLIPLI